MHPPLNRPHPDCQQEIKDYQECMANKSFLQFYACDKLAVTLDKCLKKEKAKLLRKLNADMEEKRQKEEEALQAAGGHEISFEEYLQQDAEYQQELKNASKRKGDYQKTAQGGHAYQG